MSCCPPGSGVQCDTIQIIEPDESLPVGTAGGSQDPSLTERGEETLAAGQTTVNVTFVTPKSSEQYRFEYLYVDAFGVINPGTIMAVPTVQTKYAFTVELAGEPPQEGYILRWRVVVISIGETGVIDSPESLYVQLNHTIGDESTNPIQDILFVNPRSGTSYGFTELRVENLTDDPLIQYPVFVQVVEKRIDGFKIAINPVPDSPYYYLAVRTP